MSEPNLNVPPPSASPPPDYTSVHRLSSTTNGSPVSSTNFAPGAVPEETVATSLASSSSQSLPYPSPIPPPVVLSWSPNELYNDPAPPGASHPSPRPVFASSSSRSDLSLPRPPSVTPPDDPPRYVEARAPTRPVTYTFSPLGKNALILIPPVESQDTRPLYHIAIAMNCFNPLAHITTVRRGANENGDLVGEFEMGISDCPATLNIRGKNYHLRDALKKMGTSSNRIWAWQFVQRKLYWYCKSDTKVCYESLRGEGTVYARFTPTKHPNVPTRPPTMAQLEITPDGWPLMDDILMSALIVERWRQLPKASELRELVNFHT